MPVVPENSKIEGNDVTVIFFPNDLSFYFFEYLPFMGGGGGRIKKNRKAKA